MKKIWLTYAWKDNEDADIDHVVSSLQATGLGVKYDRIHLLAGRKLWDQIDKAITTPSECDGWAIFVTRNSLASEACREEIAYALRRALDSRGEFPLIGIFPEPIDPSLVPSAIATRLYVTLQDPEWATRVADAVAGVPSVKSTAPPLNFQIKWHTPLMLEVRPRSGRWFPFAALVKTSERDRLASVIDGPYGTPPRTWMGGEADITRNNGTLSGTKIEKAITNLNSAYIGFSKLPTSLWFGQDPNYFRIDDLQPR